MTQLQRWFLGATFLAFLAGGGAGVLTNQLWAPGEPASTPGDADGYLRMFDRRIGIAGDEQRRALRAAYEGYWTEMRKLVRQVLAERRADLRRIEQGFHHRVYQVLDAEQRLRWVEIAGRPIGGAGPADGDAERPDDGTRPEGATEPAEK